jgi:hypothetical protein
MDQKAILSDYKTLRKKGIELSSALVESLSNEDLETAARRLGILRRGVMQFDTEDEAAVLMDYAIHEIRRDGVNAVERMLRDNPPPEGSAHLRLLHSLAASRYTVVGIQQIIPGFGLAGFEGAMRSPVVVVDVNFSRTAQPGISMATRLQSPGIGWSMTTGASLPLTAKALTGIIAAMKHYERQHGHEPREVDRTTLIIREALKAGVTQHVSYADPGANVPLDMPSAPIRREGNKIGRNDPCPCGSGKKYKKCCGA